MLLLSVHLALQMSRRKAVSVLVDLDCLRVSSSAMQESNSKSRRKLKLPMKDAVGTWEIDQAPALA